MHAPVWDKPALLITSSADMWTTTAAKGCVQLAKKVAAATLASRCDA